MTTEVPSNAHQRARIFSIDLGEGKEKVGIKRKEYIKMPREKSKGSSALFLEKGSINERKDGRTTRKKRSGEERLPCLINRNVERVRGKGWEKDLRITKLNLGKNWILC